MLSVGLDISTHVGMALVGEGEDRGKVIHLKDQRGFLRLQLLADEVERTLSIWKPELVAIEGYAYCVNVKAFITLVEVGTVLRAVLYHTKVKWVEVAPKTLKKWTTGKGNADKKLMAESAKKWNFSSWSDDIVDAYALAKMGQLGIEELKKIDGVQIC